jgi:hypothetical protein
MEVSRPGSSTRHFLLLLPFLFPIFSYGQKYSVGLKVAPVVSWPSFANKEIKDTLSRGLKGGFSVGALVSFPMKNKFDFVAEAGYSQKGRRIRFNEVIVNRSTFSFFDATLLLRKSYTFRLEKNVPSQVYFNLGPDIAYWIKGKGEFTGGGDWYPYEMSLNDSIGNIHKMAVEDVNRWLFGLVLGVGIRAPLLGHQNIGVELRFISGHTYFSDRNKIDQQHYPIIDFVDTMKMNLKSVSLNITYTLDFDVQQSRKGKSTLDRKIKRRR